MIIFNYLENGRPGWRQGTWETTLRAEWAKPIQAPVQRIGRNHSGQEKDERIDARQLGTSVLEGI